MEELLLEDSALSEYSTSHMRLFRGLTEFKSRPVLVRQYIYSRATPTYDLAISQHLNAVIAQTKVRHPFYCAPFQVLFKLTDAECRLSYVFDTREADATRTHSELPVWDTDFLLKYRMDDTPFFESAGAKFYRGTYIAGQQVSVIVKQYQFANVRTDETQQAVSRCLTLALTHAQHPHCCPLLDIAIQVQGDRCVVFHVLEGLSSDLESDIVERKTEGRAYTEQELNLFIAHAARALSYSHNHHIMHEDLCPASFLRDTDGYKLLDLGCHLADKTISDGAGLYVSPQLRGFKAGVGTAYSAPKADTYAVGGIVLAMATLSPTVLRNITHQPVADVIAPLSYSPRLKSLLTALTSHSEEDRPFMHAVHAQVYAVTETDHRLLQDALKREELRNSRLEIRFCQLTEELLARKRTHAEEQPSNRTARSVQTAGTQTEDELRAYRETIAQLREEVATLSRRSAELADEAQSEQMQRLITLHSGELPTAELVVDEKIVAKWVSERPFCPVFISGSIGKSSLIASLTDARNSLESHESDPDVQMWPQLLHLGSIPILLLKLRSCTSSEEAYLELRRKVKAGCMALSSVWCICGNEREALLEEMEAFARDYADIREKCGVNISKVFVFTQEALFRRKPDRKGLKTLMEEYPNLFEMRYRGVENSEEDRTCVDGFASELAMEALHQPYFLNHESGCQGNFRDRFIFLLSTLLKIASLDISYSTFLSKLPNLKDSRDRIEAHLLSVKQAAEAAYATLSHGTALDFITGDVFEPVFDERIVEQLQATYRMNEPTIVFAVMGSPGTGKSTFLNHIAQSCAAARKPPSLFLTGNTGGHTTRGGQVLSHPLYLHTKQLMLIDLEGLGGTETRDVTKAMAQKNLVKAVLTITSVLAIIVSNEAGRVVQVKEDIRLLAKLHRKFGYATKRVILLCHDREKDAETNPEFAAAVQEMNANIFKGASVVQIVNKPNFSYASEDTRTEFLHAFLRECQFEQQRELPHAQSEPVAMSELLTELFVLATSDSQSLYDLKLTRAQTAKCAKFVETTCIELRQIADTVRSDDNAQLVCCFEHALEVNFTPSFVQKLAEMPHGMQRRCRTQVELQIKALKTELASLESGYSMIKSNSQESMRELVEQMVTYRHDSAWCLVDFLYSVNEFKGKLEKIKAHFPEGRGKLDLLLAHFASQRAVKIKKSAIYYSFQIAATAATSGLVAGLRGSALIAGGALKATSKLPILVSACAALGGTIGVGVCTTALMLAKAEELLYVNSLLRKTGNINATILTLLKDNAAFPAPVLLCIGSKATSFAAFANSFLRHLSSFTPAEFDAFHRNTYTQILCFRYALNSQQPEQVNRAFLICLRMKKREQSKYAQVMLKVAERLMPAASLTCMLSDRANTYVEPLLNALQASAVPASSVLHTRKLLLWHSHQPSMRSMQLLLQQIPVPCKLTPVENFSVREIAGSMEDIKRELDTVQARSTSVLLECVEDAARQVKEMRC